MENLPIDIHSNKLLEWLISRRHCPRKWQLAVDEIRPKISKAMVDMPENEQILAILAGGQFFNYFHCKQILALLHETEKDTKNIFGFYSSQRIKDWKEITGLYERENVYLAEAANILQRFVQYEVPALRKQIAKAESAASEAERKEQDYMKQAAESRRAFERELARWGIGAGNEPANDDLRGRLLALAHDQPPAQLACLPELAKALAYFRHFSAYVGQETGDMFPLSGLLTADPARPPSEVSVFEWRHGKRPERLVPPPSAVVEQRTAVVDDDEIDFGDGEGETDIDFCTNGDEGNAGEGIQIVSLLEDDPAVTIESPESDVAQGDDARAVLEFPPSLAVLLDELDQLASFLQFRVQDERADSSADLYLTGAGGQSDRPPELAAVGLEQLSGWLTALSEAHRELGDPQRLQMLRMRTSHGFVDEIEAQMKQKQRLQFKYEQLERLAAQKQLQCADQIRGGQEQLDRLIESAKTLQENLEADISRRYNGREVYIMGEINTVLYGS